MAGVIDKGLLVQRTNYEIQCSQPACRKIFCSRPSCVRNLRLGITRKSEFNALRFAISKGWAHLTCSHCTEIPGSRTCYCNIKAEQRRARTSRSRASKKPRRSSSSSPSRRQSSSISTKCERSSAPRSSTSAPRVQKSSSVPVSSGSVKQEPSLLPSPAEFLSSTTADFLDMDTRSASATPDPLGLSSNEPLTLSPTSGSALDGISPYSVSSSTPPLKTEPPSTTAPSPAPPMFPHPIASRGFPSPSRSITPASTSANMSGNPDYVAQTQRKLLEMLLSRNAGLSSPSPSNTQYPTTSAPIPPAPAQNTHSASQSRFSNFFNLPPNASFGSTYSNPKSQTNINPLQGVDLSNLSSLLRQQQPPPTTSNRASTGQSATTSTAAAAAAAAAGFGGGNDARNFAAQLLAALEGGSRAAQQAPQEHPPQHRWQTPPPSSSTNTHSVVAQLLADFQEQARQRQQQQQVAQTPAPQTPTPSAAAVALAEAISRLQPPPTLSPQRPMSAGAVAPGAAVGHSHQLSSLLANSLSLLQQQPPTNVLSRGGVAPQPQPPALPTPGATAADANPTLNIFLQLSAGANGGVGSGGGGLLRHPSSATAAGNSNIHVAIGSDNGGGGPSSGANAAAVATNLLWPQQRHQGGNEMQE